jgi:CTP:molybdopterin cytidylyltransferase MocA
MEQSLGSINRQHPKLRIVFNEKYGEGLSTSVTAGLRAVEQEYEHLMFLLADMPYVTTTLINSLMAAYLDSGLPLGAILSRSKRAHPVIIRRRFFKELHSLEGDKVQRLFLKHPGEVCFVEPKEAFDGADIDTMDDYLIQAFPQQKVRKRLVENLTLQPGSSRKPLTWSPSEATVI